MLRSQGQRLSLRASGSQKRKVLQESEDLFGSEEEDLFGSSKKKKTPKKDKPKKKDDNLVDDSMFGKIISKAGFVLKAGDKPNILSK